MVISISTVTHLTFLDDWRFELKLHMYNSLTGAGCPADVNGRIVVLLEDRCVHLSPAKDAQTLTYADLCRSEFAAYTDPQALQLPTVSLKDAFNDYKCVYHYSSCIFESNVPGFQIRTLLSL